MDFVRTKKAVTRTYLQVVENHRIKRKRDRTKNPLESDGYGENGAGLRRGKPLK